MGALDEALARCAEISRAAKRDSGNPDEPVLFVFQAGWAAKVMITELAHPSKPTSADMFVDAGTALDGFAGVERARSTRGRGRENIAKTSSSVWAEKRRSSGSSPKPSTRTGASEAGKDLARRAAKEEAMKTKHCVAWRRTGGCDPEDRGSPETTPRVRIRSQRKHLAFASAPPGRRRERRRWYEALVREGVVRPLRSAGGGGCDGTKTTKHSHCESECEKAWKEELARLELAVDEGREDGRTEKMLR